MFWLVLLVLPGLASSESELCRMGITEVCDDPPRSETYRPCWKNENNEYVTPTFETCIVKRMAKTFNFILTSSDFLSNFIRKTREELKKIQEVFQTHLKNKMAKKYRE